MNRLIQGLSGVLLTTLIAGTPTLADDAAAEANSDSGKTKKTKKVEYVEVKVPYAPKSNTIATKLPMPLQQTPANVGVVTAALMEEQDAFSLSDALRNVSGVNIQPGSGVHDYFLIRGFNSLDGGLVLTDGAAEPEVSTYGVYNVEGVEVFKGPAGFLWGGGPMAGAVNLVRKQPLPGNLLTVGASGGSFSTYDATVDWNLANDDGDRSFRLNSIYRESDGFRDDKEGEYTAVNPAYTLRFGENASLNFNLEYVKSDLSPDSGVPLYDGDVAPVARETSYQSPGDFSEQDVLRFQIDLEAPLSERVTIRNKTYYRNLDWVTRGTLFFGVADLPPMYGGAQVVRTLTDLDDDQEYIGNQFEAVMEFDTGSVTHHLLAGLEIAEFSDDFGFALAAPCDDLFSDPPGCMPAISLFDPMEPPTIDGVTTFDFLVGDGTHTIVAPYLSDQIVFTDKFRMLIGARYDDIETTVDFSVNFQDGISGYSRDDSDTSLFGGLTFTPNDDLTIYANAGESFAPIGFRVRGAADLAPEQSTQFEIGAKKQFLGGKLHANVALYHIERENIAILDDNGVTEQAGDQESDGFEFDLAADLAKSVRLFFSYAYNDSELTRFTEFDLFSGMIVDRSGNDPAFAPRNLSNLWVSKRFGGGFGVGGGVRFVDEQFISEDNAFAIDSALIVDAMVSYDLDRWRFKLNFKNVTDEDYELRGFGASSVIPADPFAVYAGVEFRR